MSISHSAIQLAARNQALALEVVTTGSVSLSASSTGYARASGSFLTDGFRVGMEVAGSGFSNGENNAAKTITNVTALAVSCDGCVTEGTGTRTLTVGLPANRAWENLDLTPTVGEPYVQEQYLPGPMSQVTVGPYGELELLPLYVLSIYVVAKTGMLAPAAYADALLNLFTPRTELTLASGDVVRVRGDVSPYRGQLIQDESGWATLPVTIPLRCRTANTI